MPVDRRGRSHQSPQCLGVAPSRRTSGADEGRFEPCGSIIVGTVIVNRARSCAPRS